MTESPIQAPVPVRFVGDQTVDGQLPYFSIVTLLTDTSVYLPMLNTFAGQGFVPPVAEFRCADNRDGNTLDGYLGLCRLIGESRGEIVVAVHQDVRLLGDGASRLRELVAELDTQCPAWAVAGNAGMRSDGRPATRISDPHESDVRKGGPFPAPVVSLDENLLIIRRRAGVLPSADLSGFHFYGLDLCLQARLAGHTAHVIDFHVQHLGSGTVSAAFFKCRDALEAKSRRCCLH